MKDSLSQFIMISEIITGIDYDKLANAMVTALNSLNLKTQISQEQLNIVLTPTEG